MEKAIKNIVFDMGRVLLDFSPEALLTPYFSDSEDRNMMKEMIFTSGDWFQLDLGCVSEKEMLERWIRQAPSRFEEGIRTMFAEWYHYLIPIKGMMELVCLLKSQGYRCYLLSNTSVRFSEYCNNIEILRVLDGTFASAFYQLVKPDPAIYRKLCEVFDLDPEECFFVDDNQANVEGALSVGMKGFRFENYDVKALVDAMRNKNIRI